METSPYGPEPQSGFAAMRRRSGTLLTMASRFVTVQARGTLALPADIRQRHHLDEPGAQVEIIEREDGVIELRPQVAVPADQAWFWTERAQAREREVDAYVQAGDVSTFESDDDFLSHLDSLGDA